MRRLWIATLVCGIVGIGTAAGAPAAAETDIKAASDAFVAAWNKHDSKAMAAVWAPDGDLINPFGRWAAGRPEIEKLFADEHSTFMKDSTYSIADMKVRMLSPAIAFVDWEGAATGMHNADGSAAPPFKHHVNAVFVRKEGKWWLAAARPVVYPPPPPAAPANKK